VPNTAKTIQRFLSYVGFYRRIIPEFARSPKPLQHLMKKNMKFLWDAYCQIGFDYLKNPLWDTTEVFIPDFLQNLPFIIQSDFSNTTIGCVLIQEIDGERHPEWFARRVLKASEMKYSVVLLSLRDSETLISSLGPTTKLFPGYV